MIFGIETILTTISVACIGYTYFIVKKLCRETMSFKETMDLTDLPIVTFYQGEKKFNFLLDTGSSDSHINKELIDNGDIKAIPVNMKSNVTGMDGITRTVRYYNATIFFRKKKFNANFMANDLSDVFNQIKEHTGITIHGIIGSKLFEQYKYQIDFENYIAYSKK